MTGWAADAEQQATLEQSLSLSGLSSASHLFFASVSACEVAEVPAGIGEDHFGIQKVRIIASDIIRQMHQIVSFFW